MKRRQFNCRRDVKYPSWASEVRHGRLVIKHCGCGRNYTREEWERLTRLPDWDLGGETLELRNCPCNSTLGIGVGRAAG